MEPQLLDYISRNTADDDFQAGVLVGRHTGGHRHVIVPRSGWHAGAVPITVSERRRRHRPTEWDGDILLRAKPESYARRLGGFIPAEHHADLAGLAVGLVGARIVLVILHGKRTKSDDGATCYSESSHKTSMTAELLGLRTSCRPTVLHVDAPADGLGRELKWAAMQAGKNISHDPPSVADLAGGLFTWVEGDFRRLRHCRSDPRS